MIRFVTGHDFSRATKTNRINRLQPLRDAGARPIITRIMNMPPPARNPIRARDELVLLAATLTASAAAIFWSWTHSAFLLYGDAEAHIHIARRLFDSHRPGITQLGSVWLPFPHLLLVPFLLIPSWWSSGFGAAI